MANLDHKKVGQALQEVPIGDMLYGLCNNVVETQQKLDRNSVDQLIRLAEQKVELPDGQGGTDAYSLLSMGLVPSFYHFSEANFRVAIDIKHEVGGEKKLGIKIDLNAEYKDGRDEKIKQFTSDKERYAEQSSQAQGEYYSRYYSKRSGSSASFISKNVTVQSTNTNANAGEFVQTISNVTLTQAQVDNFNYLHRGQLWRPRIVVTNALGNTKLYLCVLDVNADGRLNTSSLDYNSVGGQRVYNVRVRTHTSDLPQTTWPRITTTAADVSAYIEDPEDATTPIEVQYSVHAMSHTKNSGVDIARTQRHYGMLCFATSGDFDVIDGILCGLPRNIEVDTGSDDYITESGTRNDAIADGVQSAIPGTLGGMIDVGRGYDPASANGIRLDCAKPTNLYQYQELNGGALPTAVQMTHKPKVDTVVDGYGQIKFKVLRKGSSNKPDHGCFYQQVELDKKKNTFFSKVPDPQNLPPKVPEWVTKGEHLIEERAEGGYKETASTQSSSGEGENTVEQEVNDSKNRISVGVSGTLSLEHTRKYNFEMSAASSIDAKLVAIPAPSKLVDKLIENL